MNPAFFVMMAAASLAAVQDNRPVDFDRAVGSWHIVGDRELGSCMVLPIKSSSGTATLGVMSPANSAEMTFSLQNEAWRSLKDKEETHLWVHFLTRGKITDSWNLSVVTLHNDELKPTIHFTIDRAANDGASFIDQFSTADQIAFFRDKVPVAVFELRDSSSAIKEVDELPIVPAR